MYWGLWSMGDKSQAVDISMQMYRAEYAKI